jgi:hypothetical protein
MTEHFLIALLIVLQAVVSAVSIGYLARVLERVQASAERIAALVEHRAAMVERR